MPNIAYLDFKYEKTSLMQGVYDNPFTITSSVDNNDISFFEFNELIANMMYSLDGGMSWHPVESAYICTLDTGESVMLRGDTGGWFGDRHDGSLFDNTIGDIDLSGNIMSLCALEYKNITSFEDYGFEWMFSNLFNSMNVVDASNLILPATTLIDNCYTRMFANCTKLVNAPQLPATTLAPYCYDGMFYNCTSLRECPYLPATILPDACYESMFDTCTSLVSTCDFPDFEFDENAERSCYHMFSGCTGIIAGPVLSCTTLTPNCYEGMFYGCTKMINPPVLKANTLAPYCYKDMFVGCTSLTYAPDLIATYLPQGCYDAMFWDCSNLSYIKIYALTREEDSLYGWVHNVAPSGIFIKQMGVTYPIDSDDGVPIGWTPYEIGDDILDYYTVSLSIDPEGAGTVSGAGRYLRTSEVTVVATPAEDYMFDHWELHGANVSNNERYKFTMNYDVQLTAIFNNDASNRYANMYFAIESLSDNNNIYLNILDTDEEFNLYIKINDENWYQRAVSNGTTYKDLIATLNTGDILYLGSDKESWGINSGGRIETSGNYKVYGNILSLLLYGADQNYSPDIFYYDPLFETLDNCFVNFFRGSTTLLDARNLVLPSYTVGEYSYAYMFGDCTRLTHAPRRLYAVYLDNYCYSNMFMRCSSLIYPPELPAPILSDNCYEWMFWGCTSLVNAPVLSSTSLAPYCYQGMFAGCTSLVNAPVLSATTLTSDCYYSMFEGCTSLVEAPVLPATTLAPYCYAYMFGGCTSLTEAPVLPAITLVESCYTYMFHDCEKLNYIKILAIDRALNDIYNWVHNVAPTGTFVKNASTEYLIDNDSGIPIGWTIINDTENVYYNILVINNNPSCGVVRGGGRYLAGSNVTLTAIPYSGFNFKYWLYNGIILSSNTEISFNATQNVTIIARWDKIHDYENEYLTLESLSDDNKIYIVGSAGTMHYDNNDTSRVWGTIEYCINENPYWTTYSVKNAPDYCCTLNMGDYIKIRKYNSEYGITPSIFCNRSCEVYGNIMSLYEYHLDTTQSTTERYVGINLSALRYAESFDGLFKKFENIPIQLDYYNLISAEHLILPATDLLPYCYSEMFRGCTSLSYAPVLPATDLIECYNCYDSMFRGCTSLVNAPALPATTLADKCYFAMFAGCTSLVNAPALPATTLASHCYESIFSSCTSLVNAPALSATTLADSCYEDMFAGCTSLISAPELPATTLSPHCYASMFASCTSLISAPVLPATTLVNGCYRDMFNHCTSLSYIKAMFTTDPYNASYPFDNGYQYTYYWVAGVAETGTFVKNSAATWSLSGPNGIPEGWTIQTASE